MKITFYLFLIILFLIPLNMYAQKSIDQLHGDQEYNRRGIHDGNQIRVTFGNDGNIGRRTAAEVAGGTELGCEWPKGEGEIYTSKIVMLPMAEVRDEDNRIQHIVSECHGTGTNLEYRAGGQGASVGDLDANDRWQTMCPLGGFINAEMMLLPPDSGHPAMSDAPESWPEYWPDKMNDNLDPGWTGKWNGYFGKGRKNADLESYWVTDDYQNDEFNYYPDEFDRLRRGLGLRMYYRGMQWNNLMVEDVMFVIYDVKNIGTKALDKVNFGMHPDFDNGDIVSEWDQSPDSLMFDRAENWYYSFDKDNFGFNNFTPVGYIAYALFETPGNEFDGIDNDNDGRLGDGKIISEDDFYMGVLNSNTDIIITDYTTYERTPTTLAAYKQDRPELFSGDTLIIHFIGRPQKFWPGKELEEIMFNNFDDNLNGLIDENNGAEVGEDEQTREIRYLYVGYKGMDYFTGVGSGNLLLDESRKDGIDNDGDWNYLKDDVGADGVPNSGDSTAGEWDGVPTSKYQGSFVYDSNGEPHIDATDIDESDMIGMTAFGTNRGEWTEYPLDNDEILWDAVIPGDMIETGEWVQNAFMGSGYFPMPAKHIERFSGAFMLNYELSGLLRTKGYSEQSYKENYTFYQAPDRPKLTAVPGDGRVTLYWDDLAELSIDPILGEDFEGYRIYRSTSPQFERKITNAYDGQGLLRIPIVQFDIDNDIKGLSAGVIEGVQFDLGNDTGLQHMWVDSTVVNGQRYYYLITSYDRGANADFVAPTECNFSLDFDETGDVRSASENVAVVTPNPPSLGYIPADSDVPIEHIEGFTTSSLGIEILNPTDIKDNNTYQVTFNDTVLGYGPSSMLVTEYLTLKNKTTGKILLSKYNKVHTGDDISVTEGFRLVLNNQPKLTLDTTRTKFSREGIYEPTIVSYFYKGVGNVKAADYLIVFGEIGMDTSTVYQPGRKELPAIPVNFTITNIIENKKIDFAISEWSFAADSTKNILSGGKWQDELFFLERDENDSLITTWQIILAKEPEESTNPAPGDTLYIYTLKPFLDGDVYEFTTIGDTTDVTEAKTEMDNIKVVPNPYVVTNTWERPNPYSTGRGPHELHFTHLPAKCTIRIFDIAGHLVDTIERNGTIINGTEVWDMLSKDEMEIGFGVYIYHIEADGIGEKIGKFAVIK